MTSRSICAHKTRQALTEWFTVTTQSSHPGLFLTSPSLVLSCPGCFLAKSRITSGVLNAWLMAAWIAWDARGEMTHNHLPNKSLRGKTRVLNSEYVKRTSCIPLSSSTSVMSPDMIFFRESLNSFSCSKVSFFVSSYSSSSKSSLKRKSQLSQTMGTIIKWPMANYVFVKYSLQPFVCKCNKDLSIFLLFVTCIPPDRPAAASACPAALPCFVSVFQFLISHAKPSLVYKNWIYNLRIAQNTNQPVNQRQTNKPFSSTLNQADFPRPSIELIDGLRLYLG